MKAVFIGRFQPFHEGHRRVISTYREKYDDFALAMGSPGTSRAAGNPLTAEERKDILRACFPDIEILELADEGPTEEDNRRWAEKLMRVTGAGVVISQNELVKRLVREYTDAEVVEQELYDPERFSGTEIRRRMRDGEDWQELVPDCAREEVEKHEGIIRGTKDA